MADTITLSPREFEIAKLAADDLPNKEIAARLGIALMTVKNTMTKIRRKTGARTRVGVAMVVAKEMVDVRDMRGQGQQGRERAPYGKRCEL